MIHGGKKGKMLECDNVDVQSSKTTKIEYQVAEAFFLTGAPP